MSERTFVRDFAAATGTTPAAWVRSRRLDEARRLLETTDRPVERIAGECGFGSAVTLRQNFAASFGTSQIGRASCREGVGRGRVAGRDKKEGCRGQGGQTD